MSLLAWRGVTDAYAQEQQRLKDRLPARFEVKTRRTEVNPVALARELQQKAGLDHVPEIEWDPGKALVVLNAEVTEKKVQEVLDAHQPDWSDVLGPDRYLYLALKSGKSGNETDQLMRDYLLRQLEARIEAGKPAQ